MSSFIYWPFVPLLSENCSFAYLLIILFVHSVFNFGALYIYIFFCILIYCQMNSWQRFSSHFIGCLFTWIMVSFNVQKLFTLVQSNLSILLSWAIGVLFRKMLPMSTSSKVYSSFSSSSFKGWGLILRSLIYFELFFVQGERQVFSFTLLHVYIQVSQQHLLKRCLFSSVF
jgi:hypothetical protein